MEETRSEEDLLLQNQTKDSDQLQKLPKDLE